MSFELTRPVQGKLKADLAQARDLYDNVILGNRLHRDPISDLNTAVAECNGKDSAKAHLVDVKKDLRYESIRQPLDDDFYLF